MWYRGLNIIIVTFVKEFHFNYNLYSEKWIENIQTQGYNGASTKEIEEIFSTALTDKSAQKYKGTRFIWVSIVFGINIPFSLKTFEPL